MRAFWFGQPVQENPKGYSPEYQLLQRLGESTPSLSLSPPTSWVDSSTTDPGFSETNKSVVLTGVLWSCDLGLMPLCYAFASSKAYLLG